MSPFERLEEWHLTIPARQSLRIQNTSFNLIFFLEGECALGIPGEETIRVGEGDAYSLSYRTTQVLHSIRPERETRIHFLRLGFKWKTAKTFVSPVSSPSNSEGRFEEALRRRLVGFNLFQKTLFEDHYPIARRILAEMANRDESSPWMISSLCYTLTAGLLSGEKGEEPQARRPRRIRGRPAVKRALQFLEENCHKQLTLSDIAWQVQLSGEHLARLFKQNTNRTVFGWLDLFRVERARKLLIATEWPLGQVARSSGYSTADLLARHFKKHMGYTPLCYRRMVQEGTLDPNVGVPLGSLE